VGAHQNQGNIAVSACVAALLMLLAACSSSGTMRDPSAPPQVTGTPSPSGNRETQFFDVLKPPEAASLVREPTSLAECRSLAQVVLLGRPRGVDRGRTIGDLQFIDVELAGDVVSGAPKGSGPIRVEFPGAFLPTSVDPLVDQLRGDLPSDQSVWVLKWLGAAGTPKPNAPADPTADPTRYAVVHPGCGVFTQTSDGVRAATAPWPPHETGTTHSARVEAERLGSLSALIDALR
jgi:hypothetical protein